MKTQRRETARMALAARATGRIGRLAGVLLRATAAACSSGGGPAAPTGPSSSQDGGAGPSGQTSALQNQVFSEVWSSNGFDGRTYEYKSNCVGDFWALETCFLWEVTAVVVEAPDGRRFTLDKDFNINAYSGEVTRRWVLYGPPGAGLPSPGSYTFLYYQGESIALTQAVSYAPETVGFPSGVTWSLEGSDLVTQWTPPGDAAPGMWYKVLMFPDGANVISETFEWNASSARLPDIPLADRTTGTINVAIYFSGGYAYSEYLPFVW